jgi:hypothetical protein
MFPDPQDALPLPLRPSLELYIKLAEDLARAYRSGDAGALAAFADRWVASLSWATTPAAAEPHARGAAARAANHVEEFARRHLAGGCDLDQAQFVLARSHGFASWARFAAHVDRLARGSDPFEAAADAVVAGDEAALRALLAADPGLVRATSDREHGGTLLIYTSANGVESYRQRTPANIVAIAAMLLDAGADVEATASVYGGACATLGLVATSGHPRLARVQLALLQLLLDRGARMEDDGGGHRGVVSACIGNGCPEAAAYLADRGARVHLAEAAALGRRDAVERLLEGEGAPPEPMNEALRYACVYGQTAIADLLIRRGADLASTTRDGQTAAHMAVIAGRLDTLKMLLGHHPPLEQENAYGGTVLGQTLWSAAHGGDPDRFMAIIDALLAAGAVLPEKHVPVNPTVDAFLASKGSQPEPAWHWFGEKPRPS